MSRHVKMSQSHRAMSQRLAANFTNVVISLDKFERTSADMALAAINYSLWPWVGRASEPLQNQGFTNRFRRGFWPGVIVRA